MVIFLTDAPMKRSTLGRSRQAANNLDRALTGTFSESGSMLDHGFTLELFARFIRLVAGKTKCWSVLAVAESEKKYCAF